MGWLSNLFKSDFDRLIENGTDEELEINYEKRRQEWLSRGQDGTGEKTPEMKRLDSEMSRRSAERWKKTPEETLIPITDGRMPTGGMTNAFNEASAKLNSHLAAFCCRRDS